jgi:GrpB-like predicted nucleotidyltransferase (UPF0157 family)
MELDEPVHLARHDPQWSAIARQEGACLSATLGVAMEAIEHIGSTAVPGLMAKPIIDLMIGITAYPPPATFAVRLESLAYQNLGEAGIEGRLYLRRRSAPSCNVHIVLLGGTHWLTNLALREFLRSDSAARQQYECAKLDALRAGCDMLLAYSNAKSAVIRELIARAQSAERRRPDGRGARSP